VLVAGTPFRRRLGYGGGDGQRLEGRDSGRAADPDCMREQVLELALAQLFDGNLGYVRGILGAKGLPHGVGFLVEFAAIGFDLREPLAIGHFGHDVYPSAEGLPATLHYSHREDICNAILGPAGAGEEKEPPAGGQPALAWTRLRSAQGAAKEGRTARGRL